MELLAEHLTRFACPVCHGMLRLESTRESPEIECAACGRRYPIVDGLPVLIASRAVSRSGQSG